MAGSTLALTPAEPELGMPKRKGDTLTGGTKDVNPQWFPLFATQASADAVTVAQFPVPVQRLKNDDQQSQVMEILKISWDVSFGFPVDGATFIFGMYLTTVNTTALLSTPAQNTQLFNLRNRGNCIDYHERIIQTQTAVGVAYHDDPIIHDLTDNDGHGILVATDNVWVTLISQTNSTAATGALNQGTCKLLYRWKNVKLQEYIGIVQSQQQ